MTIEIRMLSDDSEPIRMETDLPEPPSILTMVHGQPPFVTVVEMELERFNIDDSTAVYRPTRMGTGLAPIAGSSN